jgi:hypothetical protein
MKWYESIKQTTNNNIWQQLKKLLVCFRNHYSQTRLKRTARDRPFLFVITGVRYCRVNLCTKMTTMSSKTVRYNRVFVNNRVRYNRVSLYTGYSFTRNSVDKAINLLLKHQVHRHFPTFQSHPLQYCFYKIQDGETEKTRSVLDRFHDSSKVIALC